MAAPMAFSKWDCANVRSQNVYVLHKSNQIMSYLLILGPFIAILAVYCKIIFTK